MSSPPRHNPPSRPGEMCENAGQKGNRRNNGTKNNGGGGGEAGETSARRRATNFLTWRSRVSQVMRVPWEEERRRMTRSPSQIHAHGAADRRARAHTHTCVDARTDGGWTGGGERGCCCVRVPPKTSKLASFFFTLSQRQSDRLVVFYVQQKARTQCGLIDECCECNKA